MGSLPATVLVFLGAGCGGATRHVLNLAIQRWLGSGFPWGIFAINVTGSLIMGFLAGWLEARADMPGATAARMFFATGMLGGYTTFSSFSLDAMALMERGAYGLAGLYVIGSVSVALLACGVGLAAARGFH